MNVLKSKTTLFILTFVALWLAFTLPKARNEAIAKAAIVYDQLLSEEAHKIGAWLDEEAMNQIVDKLALQSIDVDEVFRAIENGPSGSTLVDNETPLNTPEINALEKAIQRKKNVATHLLQLLGQKLPNGAYLFLMTQNGVILAHPNSALNLRPISDFAEELSPPFLLQITNQKALAEFTMDEQKKFILLRKIKETGWLVGLIVHKNKLVNW